MNACKELATEPSPNSWVALYIIKPRESSWGKCKKVKLTKPKTKNPRVCTSESLSIRDCERKVVVNYCKVFPGQLAKRVPHHQDFVMVRRLTHELARKLADSVVGKRV